jgi:hypothetical protein
MGKSRSTRKTSTRRGSASAPTAPTADAQAQPEPQEQHDAKRFDGDSQRMLSAEEVAELVRRGEAK